MFRMQSGMVMKYSTVLDRFVKIRVFSAEEIAKLLKVKEIPNRRYYEDLVLNACIADYSAELHLAIEKLRPDMRVKAEEDLYALAIKVNPSLDIQNISIPVEEPRGLPAREIHLIEERSVSSRSLDWVKTLEEDLSRHVIGQEEAIRKLSHSVRKSAAGLRDQSKPVGTFFFVGQTGVGKTELAKSLTRQMFQEAEKLIRIDCSEYSLPHEYAKLIGAPPGYIGYNEGGQLTERVKQAQGGVVLFDEIEKADPKVYNLLLQIMDEGFVTDAKGGRVHFDKCVIIFTSNVGTFDLDQARRSIGFGPREKELESAEQEGIIHEAIRRHFRPEFINRVDEIVVFRSLNLGDCQKILDNILNEVKTQARNVNIDVRFENQVKEHLAGLGYKPQFGARELRRTVKRLIEGPLSDRIVDGKISSGDSVQVRMGKGGRILFSKN